MPPPPPPPAPPPRPPSPPPTPPRPPGGGPPPPPQPGSPAGTSVRLKGLHWEKIPQIKAQSTIWGQASEEMAKSPVKLDVEQLNTLFAIKEVQAAQAVAAVDDKKKRVHLVDNKRATNLGIQLAGLRRSPHDIRAALESVDPAFLTADVLNVLLNTVPSKEEVEMLKAYEGDISRLGDVEKYFLEAMKVPRMQERIQVMLFHAHYQGVIASVEAEVGLLREACSQLRNSHAFIRLLEWVLAVGNQLNGGTFRGQALGFRLDSLLKLMDVKSSISAQTSLLHFVVGEMLKAGEDLSSIPEQLDTIPSAAKLNMVLVRARIDDLNKGLKMVEGEAAECDGKDDRFRAFISQFVGQAKTETQRIAEINQTGLNEYKAVASYFGEVAKDTPEILTVFVTIREFLFVFDRVVMDVEKKAAKGARPRHRPLDARPLSQPGVLAGQWEAPMFDASARPPPKASPVLGMDSGPSVVIPVRRQSQPDLIQRPMQRPQATDTASSSTPTPSAPPLLSDFITSAAEDPGPRPPPPIATSSAHRSRSEPSSPVASDLLEEAHTFHTLPSLATWGAAEKEEREAPAGPPPTESPSSKTPGGNGGWAGFAQVEDAPGDSPVPLPPIPPPPRAPDPKLLEVKPPPAKPVKPPGLEGRSRAQTKLAATLAITRLAIDPSIPKPAHIRTESTGSVRGGGMAFEEYINQRLKEWRVGME